MSQRTVELNLAGEHKLARDVVAGGVFVPGYDLSLNVEVELVLHGNGDELRVPALVVWCGNGGVGLQLHDTSAEMKQRISALAIAAAEGAVAAPEPASTNDAESDGEPAPDAEPAPEPDPDGDADGGPRKALTMHERLRGLSLAQQVKAASHGEAPERILLERMYGKNVWEALLRNPRLTGPEVARIARMGTLARPQMELILNNGGWLQIPEVRRALLTNPRLGTDQILRILRLLPKHEIKIAAAQTVYPLAVRDAAKRLIKEMGQ